MILFLVICYLNSRARAYLTNRFHNLHLTLNDFWPCFWRRGWSLISFVLYFTYYLLLMQDNIVMIPRHPAIPRIWFEQILNTIGSTPPIIFPLTKARVTLQRFRIGLRSDFLSFSKYLLHLWSERTKNLPTCVNIWFISGD